MSFIGNSPASKLLLASDVDPSVTLTAAALSLTNASGITLSGSNAVIKGDFSSAINSGRTIFQSTTTNGNTYLALVPNGSGTSVGIDSNVTFNINTAATLAIQIDTNQNVSIGASTTNNAGALQVYKAAAGGNPTSSGSTDSNQLAFVRSSSGDLRIGIGTGGAIWLQNSLPTNFATNYGLLLNPNGGNVAIGYTSVSSGVALIMKTPAGTWNNVFGADVIVNSTDNTSNIRFTNSAHTTSLGAIGIDTSSNLTLTYGASLTNALAINTSGAWLLGSGKSAGTSGQVLSSGGSAAAPSWVNFPTMPTMQSVVYTSGTNNWTVPSGVTAISVVIVGGGGGGGGASCGATYALVTGGGGGGGEVIYKEISLVGAGATISCVVGAGGNAGSNGTYNTANGTAGTAGGASTVTVGSTVYTAKGGSQGTQCFYSSGVGGNGGNGGNYQGNYGLGGVAPATNVDGTTGTPGTGALVRVGGGGGGSGTGGNRFGGEGGYGVSPGGSTVTSGSHSGGAGGGSWGQGGIAGNNLSAGTAPDVNGGGGGAGGTANTSNTANWTAAQAGAAGVIMIFWYA